MILGTRKARSLAVVLAAALVAGCSVSPKQIWELRRFVPTEEKREAKRLLETSWRLYFAGGEFLVVPTATPDGGLLFSGVGGLRVFFDGREITAIEGLPGGFGSFRVGKAGNVRRFERGGRRSYEVRCDSPRDWQLTPRRSGWRIECRGELNGVPVITQHAVEWDVDKSVTLIVSTVAPGAAPLVLRPNGSAATPYEFVDR